MKVKLFRKSRVLIIGLAVAVSAVTGISFQQAWAVTAPSAGGGTTINLSNNQPQKYYCGDAQHGKVYTSINIGCSHQGNPITDMLFAIIRLLSDGVGIVVIGSIIVAGIQYSASRGDPKATEAALTRIRSSLVALLIFIFAYAMLNYVIPAGFFQ